ncbi:hypothetical protein M422DRAFT_194191, partial [Sphaerobolus stellatus SS14]
NTLSISKIDFPDFLPNQCTFEFANNAEVTLINSFDSQNGLQQLFVGPPTPIVAVTCTGTCISTFGDCFINGSPLGECCAGFCAGNKCRPFVNP